MSQPGTVNTSTQTLDLGGEDEPVLDLAGNVLSVPTGIVPPPVPAPAKAKKAPAKKAPAKKDDKPPAPVGRPSNSAKRRDSLDDTIQSIALGVGLMNAVDGAAISEGGPKLADALNNLADANPRIARALDRTTAATGWAGVVIALGGILVPIAANHGIIPTTAVEIGSTPVGTPSMPSPADLHRMAAGMVDGMTESQAAIVLRGLGISAPGD